MEEEPNRAVRPLDVISPSDPVSPPSIPIAARVLALLTTVVLIGWLLGSAVPGDRNQDEGSPVVRRSSQASVGYQWVEVDLPAGIPLATAEIDGVLFVLLDVWALHDLTDATLWASTDGDTWREVSPARGSGSRLTDLDTYRDTLILSGSIRGTPTLWRSTPGRTIDRLAWTETVLQYHGRDFGPISANLTTTVTATNDAGEVFTTARVYPDANPMVFATSDGVNLMTEVDRDGGQPGRLGTWSSWASADGLGFDLVGGAFRLPSVPLALGYRSNFLNRASDGRSTRLWQSASGRGWAESTWRKPAECGDWDSLAISAERLLLVTPLFDSTCVSDNGVDWVVAALPDATSDASLPAGGGRDGFVIVTTDEKDWLLSSTDGIIWERIETPQSVVTPRVQFVGDRIIALGSSKPSGGPTWWIGTPSS